MSPILLHLIFVLLTDAVTYVDYLLDEMERAMHDSLCAIKRTLESGSVVPGGGAVETALSIYLENFATTLVRLISPSTVERTRNLTHLAGLPRTTRDSRVCQRPPRDPKDACRQRRQGLD